MQNSILENFMASATSWAETQEQNAAENSRLKVTSRRINSTLNFIPGSENPAEFQGQEPFPFFETYSTAEQEKILTQEILYILTGVEGNLISTVHPMSSARPTNKIEFMVDCRVESSLRDLALQISQLAGYYYTVTRYVENWSRFEHGQVNQALSASIRSILKDYLMLIAQMETMYKKDELTLQKLWFFIHPTLQTMTILSSIVISIEEVGGTGGQVLTILHEKSLAMIGDALGQKLCYGLAESASKPYFGILENWIYKGAIKDPFFEFFIHDDQLADEELQNTDNYWEQRYKASLHKCPSFLKKVSNEILKAGKYLNVIRQCGKNVMLYMGGKITYSIHERVYIAAVEKAYSFASKSLLDLLLKDYDLMKRLESVKHHLLMDQGDFIVQFLDLTESELSKEVDDINETRLTSLLELALRTSSSWTDPYKDSVKVELFPYSIREQMLKIIYIADGPTNFENESMYGSEINFRIPGVEAFAFSYEVQWPISLVLGQRAVTCYQMIFRHLFYCKHVERQLCKVWIGGKQYKNICLSKDLEKARAFSLRQKMLNFVQNLQYYISFEVIEPAWHNFLAMMAKVQNVDEVLKAHIAFINAVLDDSMLTNPDVLANMSNLLKICLEFCKNFLHSSLHTADKQKNLRSTLETLDAQFTSALVEFLRRVLTVVQNPNKSTKGVNIIHRMNFNSYYTSALEVGLEDNISAVRQLHIADAVETGTRESQQ